MFSWYWVVEVAKLAKKSCESIWLSVGLFKTCFTYIWLASLRFTIFSVRFYPIFQLASGRIEIYIYIYHLATSITDIFANSAFSTHSQEIGQNAWCRWRGRVMSALPFHITLRLLQTQQKFFFTHTIRAVNGCNQSLSKLVKNDW